MSSVLQILRMVKERGPISRTELQRASGLSWGTITNSTRELLERKLAREQTIASNRPGRKPTSLALDQSRHALVGVELTHEAARCVAVDLAGGILWQQAMGEANQGAMLELANRALEGVSGRECMGIGIAAPGRMDGAGLREALAAQVKAPVWLERSWNCLALAERWHGAGGSVENLLCIQLGEAAGEMGMGMILGGRIYHGAQGLAGELAHVTVESGDDAPVCACGDRGCVEVYCSAAAVMRRAGARSLDELLDLARREVPAARESFAVMGKYLGIAAANLFDVLNPELVVICGRMAECHGLFMPALEAEVEKHGLKGASKRVVVSTLGDQATVLGACARVLEGAFEGSD